jgi:hypothetical protein
MDDSSRADVIVDRLHPDEIESGAKLLAASFVDEPLFAYIFEGKDRGRVERTVTSFFRGWIRSFIQQGEIHAARVDGTLVGVGVRVPPGGYPLRGTQKALFMLRLMRGVARMSATSTHPTPSRKALCPRLSSARPAAASRRPVARRRAARVWRRFPCSPTPPKRRLPRRRVRLRRVRVLVHRPRSAPPIDEAHALVEHRPRGLLDAFQNADLIAPRPLLLVVGRKAVTSWMSINAYQRARAPKELHWIEGASHIDLYIGGGV